MEMVVGTKELLDQKIKDLESRKRELECYLASLEQRCEAKLKVLEVVEGSLMELQVKMKEYQDLVRSGKELKVWYKQLELKVKDLEEYAEKRYKECRAQSELLDRRDMELELKMKNFDDRVKVFEEEFQLKEKRVVDGSLSVDSSGTLVLQVVLNEEDVNVHINGHKNNLSSREEVSEALRLSGAPVLLLLEVMEVLLEENFGMRFEGSVGRSCLLLLEELISISPKIESDHREHALRLALKWKDMLSVGNSLEVLAFLYLLALFDFAPSFDTKEVMKLFQTVAEHWKRPALCHCLGLKDKMPGENCSFIFLVLPSFDA